MLRTGGVPRGDAQMKLPIIRGVVQRRLLLNYRIDPGALGDWLPEPFEPRLHRGWVVAGVCLIRMRQLPPAFAPFGLGLGSENAAHRVAVRWSEEGETRDGVYVYRSHTNSLLGHLAGRTVLPGEQRRAHFEVHDDGRKIELFMRSSDRRVTVEISGQAAAAMPASSVFSSIREASHFFERGSLGYAPVQGGRLYEGVLAEPHEWVVHPLAVTHVHASLFDDEGLFTTGRAEFDHALVMRDVEHVWRGAPELDRRSRRRVTGQPARNQ
jgi:hypothetical protein